jgi:hypothetical protein
MVTAHRRAPRLPEAGAPGRFDRLRGSALYAFVYWFATGRLAPRVPSRR